MSIREITQVTDTEINDIKEKSAYSLPNRPTDSGLTAEQIKQHYYEPIVDDEKSIIALMKDKIDEINDALGDVATEIGNVVDDVEDGTTIADKADKDSDGNKITSTYETKSSVTVKLAKKTNYGDLSLTNTMSTIYSSYGDKPFVFSVGGVMAYIGLVSRGLPVGSATFEYKMYAFELKLSDQVSIYYRTGMSGSTALSGVLSSTYKHILATKSSVDDVSSRVTDLESDYKDKKSEILDYTNHTNKPQINSVTLSGNKSWSDLGLTKAVLTGIIGAATDSADGYMSSTDHEKLTTLYALLGESADDDSFVNTINEILAIFNNYPEGADLVTALASKVSISDIVDNLTSQATNKPLSANQGYVLDGKIDFLGDGLTNLLNGTSISKKAQQDKDGNDIHSTYIKQSEKSAMEEEMEVNVLEELVGGEVTIFEGTAKEETTNFEDKIDECNEAIASIDSKANVDGNYPTMSVGEADVAKNIKAYSDESGALQESPFISQGTGTNNNVEIVTTGDFCELKSKNGNSVVYNQLAWRGVSSTYWDYNDSLTLFSYNSATNQYTLKSQGLSYYWNVALKSKTISGHKYLVILNVVTFSSDFFVQLGGSDYSRQVTSSGFKTYLITGDGTNAIGLKTYQQNTNDTIVELDIIDLTQMYPLGISQDLLDHPSNFFRYYNGSLAYSTGELINANGRYLECGQSRNIWDEEWEVGFIDVNTGQNSVASDSIRSKNYIQVSPNNSYYCYAPNCETSAKRIRIYFYDANKTFIKMVYMDNLHDGNGYGSGQFEIPSNSIYIRFSSANQSTPVTYNHDITISLYYTAEQGGEGYNQYYPYKAPILIDTGTEALLAFDKKYRSGVIERNTQDDTISVSSIYDRAGNTNVCFAVFTLTKAFATGGGLKAICPNGIIVSGTTFDNCSNPYIILVYDTQNKQFAVSLPYGTTLESAQSLLDGTHIQYRLATPTTEQGTPYPRYPDIIDYSYMLWKDTNNALVTIPQGASIFYPVNYAGTLDDLVSYVDGDVTKLALKTDVTAEETARTNYDTILQNAIGGTLRQCLCVKENLSFDNTDVVDLGTLSWFTTENSGGYFYAILSFANYKNICSKYKTGDISFFDSPYPDKTIVTYKPFGQVCIRDTTYTDATTFKNAMKGVLLAYEKA